MAARKGGYVSAAPVADDGADGQVITRRRIAAGVAQVGGWYTTWRFIAAVGGGGIVGLGISIAAEWLLFEFKRTVLSGEDKGDIYGWVAILIDTILNAGGLWAVILNLDNTDSYAMLAKSLEVGSGEMRLLPALVIALGVGYLLAIAPHRLWHGRLRRG